jgi:hypothetical protein
MTAEKEYRALEPALAAELRAAIGMPVANVGHRTATAATWSAAHVRAAKAGMVAFVRRRIRLLAIAVLARMPDTGRLLELTGLDPIRWIHRLSGEHGEFAVVVECASGAQRTAVEAQLDSATIEHRRPDGTTPESWWATVSGQGGEFEGATEATWEILLAYAETLGTEKRQAVRALEAIDALRALAESRIND